MDRLSALIVVAIAGLGCDKKDAPAGEPSGRVNAAKTGAKRGATPEAFCDVHHPAASAPAFAWSAAIASPPPAAPAKWRWINIWATWCKPCLEEMPRLAKWRDKLGVQLTFISVDESDADVEAFRKLQPDTPESIRLDQTKANEWFAQLGLAGSSTIPIHIFVDPAGKLRCVRAAGVTEPDLAVVEKLLAE
jgi:thiol-disulfide isomerase/thioredoxin